MTPPFIARINRDDIPGALALAHAVAPHLTPLIRAVGRGIRLAGVPRAAPFPRELLEYTRPVIAIVEDDDFRSTGPAGFPAAKRFAYWARREMVHASAAEARHYQLAVDAAMLHGRILLVETDSEHASEWCRFLGDGRRIPLLCIRPRDGVHPVAPRREALQ
jgi:hypothetical protein